MRDKPPIVVTAVLLLSTLTACGGLNNNQIEDAIEKSFGEEGVCWALNDMDKASFPIRTGFDPMAKQSNAILTGLVQQGFIDVGQEEVSTNPYGFFSQKQMLIDLTPAGKKVKVWDEKKGFCIGHKRVVEVTRFSEPSDQSGMQMTQVEYKWAIKDTPSWLEPAAFTEIRGIAEPVEQLAVLRKMSDGWQVLGD